MVTYMPKQIRPATLSSGAARRALDHLGVQEFQLTFATIDRLSELWSSLATLRETPDSRQTPESRALAYREQHQRAAARADALLRQAGDALAARRERLRADALRRSGLAETYPQAEEVRAVLRGLSQEERDRAVDEAIDAGQAWIIAAIRNYPPLLTGRLTKSPQMIEDLFLARTSPDLSEQMEQIDTAAQSLAFAADGYRRATETMRDLPAEDRADDDAKAVSEAEVSFARAMGGSA